jgi:hypothetical protein
MPFLFGLRPLFFPNASQFACTRDRPDAADFVAGSLPLAFAYPAEIGTFFFDTRRYAL